MGALYVHSKQKLKPELLMLELLCCSFWCWSYFSRAFITYFNKNNHSSIMGKRIFSWKLSKLRIVRLLSWYYIIIWPHLNCLLTDLFSETVLSSLLSSLSSQSWALLSSVSSSNTSRQWGKGKKLHQKRSESRIRLSLSIQVMKLPGWVVLILLLC